MMHRIRIIFETIAKKNTYLNIVIFASVVLCLTMNYMTADLNKFENNIIPDIRFGFTREDLDKIFSDWGEEGISIYLRSNFFDFMFIPCYTLLLGSLMVIASQKADIFIDFTPLIVIAAVCDLFETAILRKAAIIFPMLTSEKIASLGSLSQQIKWVCLCTAIFFILLLGFRGRIDRGKKNK